MRSILLVTALAMALVTPGYAAISENAGAFLKEIGVDPASPDVISISNDVVSNKDVSNVSLNSLAAKRDEEGVKRFIATRVFIHKYMIDTSAQEPSAELYETLYLSETEKRYVFCQFAKGYMTKSDLSQLEC